MSHIVSYVKRHKEHDFLELPFNEVDALILSQFIYLKLDNLIPIPSERKNNVFLYEISNRMDYDKVIRTLKTIQTQLDELYRTNDRK